MRVLDWNAKCIVFDVTNACNMNCRHCYKKTSRINNIDEKSIYKFLLMIGDYIDINNIVISGGEPLLYPEIKNMLLYLNGKYNIRLNTNGVLLDKYLDVFYKMTKFKIQVSLDGYDNDTYYNVRNNNSFDKVIYNSVLCNRMGLNIVLRATLTNNTIDDYRKFFIISEKTNIPLKIKPMLNMETVSAADLHIGKERLMKWYNDLSYSDKSNYIEGDIFNDKYQCSLLKEVPTMSTLYIDEKGEMYPCIGLQNDMFKLGNIKDTDYKSIGENLLKVTGFVKSILNEKKCINCGFRNDIGDGTCIAACFYGREDCFNKTIQGE